MPATVQYSTLEAAGHKVAVLTMDNPPMNPLGSGVRVGLEKGLNDATADATVKAVVVTGGHGVFSAGADVSEFSKGFGEGMLLPEICAALEATTKPVVAAVDGISFGGGLELALGCHWRVASTRAQAGLPEVNLGLLPGAGGTQRMPRLIGAEASMDFIVMGAPMPAKKAAEVGIYDQVVEGDHDAVVKAAAAFAVAQVGKDLGPRRLSNVNAKAIDSSVFEKKLKQYAKVRAGEVAPQAIVRCIQAATSKNFDEGMETEQEEMMNLLIGPQAKALQYMFFAERECAKIPGLTAKPRPLNVAAVVGAGLMGGGIAMCCAEAGMKVYLVDVAQESLDKGMAVIKKNYARSVERKSKTQAAVDKIIQNFHPTLSYSDLKDCDIVIEAVFENMKVKKQIFAELDKVCKPGCVLASNTSFLNIDEIASATKRPEDVIGCHFFSPANVMKLLENVRGSKSSGGTIATAMELGKRLKKVTCLVGNCDGFIANRTMGKSGSQFLLQNGSMPHQIDAASEAFGMKMGPMRMGDLVGLDLFGRERANSGQAKPDTTVIDAMFAAGRFGQKNGKGYYKYDEKRSMSRDPVSEEIITNIWKKTGVAPRDLSHEEINEKLYFPVINEGFKCLEEGIAIRASDIDVCLVFGYNWPRFTGGPMQFASSVGLKKVLETLQKMGEKPADLLVECVEKKWKLNSKELQQRLEQNLKSKL